MKKEFWMESGLAYPLMPAYSQRVPFWRQKKLVKKADKKKVEASIEEKLKEEDATLAESFIFDISIRDKDGEEIQPDTSRVR